MSNTAHTHGLGRTCPRCKTFNLIFSGVDSNGAHLLPVKGKFQYPCANCGWAMECDTKLLESSRDAEKAKKKSKS